MLMDLSCTEIPELGAKASYVSKNVALYIK
jgi:hypothetical protein